MDCPVSAFPPLRRASRLSEPGVRSWGISATRRRMPHASGAVID
jgi:hypothetical protein